MDVSLKCKGEVQGGDVNLGIIEIYTLLKAVTLGGITNKVNVDGEQHRYKLGPVVLQQGEKTQQRRLSWDRNQECVRARKSSEKVWQGGGSV